MAPIVCASAGVVVAAAVVEVVGGPVVVVVGGAGGVEPVSSGALVAGGAEVEGAGAVGAEVGVMEAGELPAHAATTTKVARSLPLLA